MKKELIAFVRQRAKYRCEYCQISELVIRCPFQIDHVVSRQHEGSNEPGNLAWSCLSCNKHKGPNIAARDSATRKLVPLFNPRRHVWARHFLWNGPFLRGLSPIGRTTIRLLKINSPDFVDVRRELIEDGLFPPTDSE